MNRLLLRFLNSPALVLVTAIAIAIQTSLFATWPIRFFEPDVVLLVVLWCSLRREFAEGGILTLIIAEIAEIHSAAPQGILLVSYMTVYLLFRGAAKVFVLPTDDGWIRVGATAAVLWRFAMAVSLHLLAPNHASWYHLLTYMIPAAVIQAVAGLWVFKWLEKFDAVTFKNASMENPDEFQIDNLSI